MTQTNDFTNDSGEFEPAPPLLAASTPFPNSDLVEDDPRDIFSTISLAGDPDTPLSVPELSGADLAAQGLDAIRGVGPVGDIPRITTIPPAGPVTHLEEMSFVTPTLRMLSPKPIEGPLKVAGYSARPVEPPVGDISGGKEGVEAQIDLIGRYEAFLARVRSVHYVKTNGHPVARQHPVIDYQRVWSSYDTNHEPKVGIAGSSNSRPIPGVNFAYPFPLRHDQARYIVARDDVVTIIQGEDRAYYMVDELPFLAQVMSHVDVDYVVTARQDAPPAGPLETDRYLVGASGSGDWAGQDNKIATWGAGAWAFTATSNDEQVYASGSDNYWLKAAGTWSTTTNVKEINNGGAGNKTLRVIRKALAGVPGSTTVAGMSDLQDASSVDIEYEHVMVVGPSNSAHGYRVGDHVWVFKRGQYLFAMKTPKTFVAKLQLGASKDPTESLADFTTNHYWFKEQTPTIAYTDDKWTVTWNAVNAADPTGSGGRWGRWADAVNLAEGAAEHGLADGDLVIVSDVSDAATGEIGYVFQSTLGLDRLVTISGNDTTPSHVEDKLVGETASDRTPVKYVTNNDGANETRGLYIDHADFPAPTPTTGDLPRYDGSKWEAKSIDEVNETAGVDGGAFTEDFKFDVPGTFALQSVDATRDYRNRIITCMAFWDTGAPVDGGSWNEDDVKIFDVGETGRLQAEPGGGDHAHGGQTLGRAIISNPTFGIVDDLIFVDRTGNQGDFYIKVDQDSGDLMALCDAFTTRFQVWIRLVCGKQTTAAETVELT